MKVIQINCVYRQGSTGKLVYEIHRHLRSQGIESRVLYGRGAKSEDPDVRKLCSEGYAKVNNLISRLRGTMYGGCWLATKRLIRILRREQPDVVHLHCINGYFVNIYRLVHWLKAQRIPTVLTLHAEFMYTANCGHALTCEKWRIGCGNCPRWRQETKSWLLDGTARSFRQMRRAFSGFEENLSVVSVSPWLQERAKQSQILGSMTHQVIYNGVDTEVFYHQHREEIGEMLIFHATAMFSDTPDHPKGGAAVLALAKRMEDLPVRFVVAGKYKLRQPIPKNVILLGEVQDQNQLADWYRKSDVTLLTSLRETFSMVCAESLCCGTPVVGYKAGGPESVCPPGVATFVPRGDLDALEEALRQQFKAAVPKAAISQSAMALFSQERMGRAYETLYREACHEAAP